MAWLIVKLLLAVSQDCRRADDGQTNSVSFETICLAVEHRSEHKEIQEVLRNGGNMTNMKTEGRQNFRILMLRRILRRQWHCLHSTPMAR
jgi:hypothetical protein